MAQQEIFDSGTSEFLNGHQKRELESSKPKSAIWKIKEVQTCQHHRDSQLEKHNHLIRKSWQTVSICINDQTHAIPHWLWNQPSAPPVHPEGDVKGCLGNAMKVSEPQKVSSHHLWNIMDHGSWWIIMTSRQVNSEGLCSIEQQLAASS